MSYPPPPRHDNRDRYGDRRGGGYDRYDGGGGHGGGGGGGGGYGGHGSHGGDRYGDRRSHGGGYGGGYGGGGGGYRDRGGGRDRDYRGGGGYGGGGGGYGGGGGGGGGYGGGFDARRGRDRDREPPRQRRRSPSDDFSSGSPEPRERLRPTWFDVTPEMVAQGQGGRSEEEVKDLILKKAGEQMPVDKSGLQLTQATRHARRIYVGGLPPSANEDRISSFFSYALAAVGGNTGGVGNAVVNVYINYEKKFAFVELRTVEEASNAMALDGIMFEGVAVRIRRPNDYNPAHAARLGPGNPNPNLNLAAVNLTPGGMDSEDRIFLGGLPYHFDEGQCRQLLEPFGELQSFELVRDREKGESKGYGFAVFADKAVTESAIVGLNGLTIDGRVLTCRKATEGHGAGGFGLTAAQAGAMGVPAAATGPVTSTSGATRIIVLTGCVTRDELLDDETFAEIQEDMMAESQKHGRCINVVIPRPRPDGNDEPHTGKVIIEFEDANVAMRARNALHGRKFGGNEVEATFLPEHLYSKGEYAL